MVRPQRPAVYPRLPRWQTGVAQRAWQIARQILDDPSQRPPRGRGRLIALAREVNAELANHGLRRKDDSIRKAIGPSLRVWEAKNPEK